MGSATNDHDHDHDGAASAPGTSAQDGSYVDDDVRTDGSRSGGPHDGEDDGTYTEELVSDETDGSYVDADVPDERTDRGGPHDGEPDGSFTRSDLDAES